MREQVDNARKGSRKREDTGKVQKMHWIWLFGEMTQKLSNPNESAMKHPYEKCMDLNDYRYTLLLKHMRF